MTDRAPSNFSSGVLGSAWYLSAPGQICRSTGFSLLADLKSNLRDVLATTGPLPTSGGTTIAMEQVEPLLVDEHTGVVTGDGWSTDTLRALYAVAQHFHVPAEFTAAIQNDLQIARFRQGQPLSTRTMQVAMWFPSSGAYDANGDITLGHRSPAEISFGPGAVFPGFGTIPEAPADRVVVSGAVCVPESQDSGAQGPVHAPGRLQISDWLIIIGVTATAVGAALLTSGAPTRAQQRAARRNPQLEAMSTPERRYAIATMSREQLIAALRLRNPRGLYTDADRVHAGLFPLTHASAATLAHRMMS